MGELKIRKLITTKCELMVGPATPIEPDDRFVYLEFVVGEGIDCYDNAEISSSPEVYKFPLDDDGLFTYYCLKIYKKSYLGEYTTEKFYYDDTTPTPRLMLGDAEIATSKALEEVINNSFETEYSIMDMVEEPVFSICRLEHCHNELQRKFVLDGCSENKKCGTNKDDSFAREFLFSTIFVLRQLIKQYRFEEALRILKTVSTCYGLCSDTTSSKNKKCNCCR